MDFYFTENTQGHKKEAEAIKMEFLRQVKESGEDHCSCKEPCRHHGNCFECVTIHRGHRDHLPFCFWSMVNESFTPLSRMTEGSLCADPGEAATPQKDAAK